MQQSQGTQHAAIFPPLLSHLCSAFLKAHVILHRTANICKSCPSDLGNTADTDFAVSNQPSVFSDQCRPPHMQHHNIPIRHASDLTYEQFVAKYMSPNLPVMIQVKAQAS